MLLSQALKLQNRERLGRFKRLTEQMRHLLCNRPSLSFRSGLKLLVEGIWEVLDISTFAPRATVDNLRMPE